MGAPAYPEWTRARWDHAVAELTTAQQGWQRANAGICSGGVRPGVRDDLGGLAAPTVLAMRDGGSSPHASDRRDSTAARLLWLGSPRMRSSLPSRPPSPAAAAQRTSASVACRWPVACSSVWVLRCPRLRPHTPGAARPPTRPDGVRAPACAAPTRRGRCSATSLCRHAASRQCGSDSPRRGAPACVRGALRKRRSRHWRRGGHTLGPPAPGSAWSRGSAPGPAPACPR